MLSRFSYDWLFVTLWAIALQAHLSMGFSRQEYWSGLPCPPPGIFLAQGWNTCFLYFLHWQVNSLPLSHLGQSLSMLLQMSESPSFSWLKDIPLCVCMCVCVCVLSIVYICVYIYICVCVCVYIYIYIFIFCIYLTTEGHSDCFCILASFLFLDSHSYLVQLRKV